MDHQQQPEPADLDLLAFAAVLLAELLDRDAIDLDVLDLVLAEAAETQPDPGLSRRDAAPEQDSEAGFGPILHLPHWSQSRPTALEPRYSRPSRHGQARRNQKRVAGCHRTTRAATGGRAGHRESD